MFQSDLPGLVRRLKGALGARVIESGPVMMPSYVLPVLDVDRRLGNLKVEYVSVDLTPAAGTFVPAYTVPAKRLWRLLFWWNKAEAVDYQAILRRPGDATDLFYKHPLSAGSQEWELNGLELTEGWQIAYQANGSASATHTSYLYFLELENDAGV